MFTDLHPLINILLLSLMASLGTGIGGLIAVLRKPGRRSYGLLMGITAGVMICLAFLELVNEAWDMAGPWVATVGFGAGATFMLLLDHFAPHIRFGEKEVRGVTEPVDPNCRGKASGAGVGMAGCVARASPSITNWSTPVCCWLSASPFTTCQKGSQWAPVICTTPNSASLSQLPSYYTTSPRASPPPCRCVKEASAAEAHFW